MKRKIFLKLVSLIMSLILSVSLFPFYSFANIADGYSNNVTPSNTSIIKTEEDLKTWIQENNTINISEDELRDLLNESYDGLTLHSISLSSGKNARRFMDIDLLVTVSKVFDSSNRMYCKVVFKNVNPLLPAIIYNATILLYLTPGSPPVGQRVLTNIVIGSNGSNIQNIYPYGNSYSIGTMDITAGDGIDTDHAFVTF